jgi:hypothetical protein
MRTANVGSRAANSAPSMSALKPVRALRGRYCPPSARHDPNESFATDRFRDLEPKLVLYLQRAFRGRHRARVDGHVIPNIAMGEGEL